MNEAQSQRREFSLSRLVGPVAIAGVVAAIAYLYGVNSVEQPSGELEGLRIYGMDSPIQNRLHDVFTDNDGDLVADLPKDESQWLDPPVLNFSYLSYDQQRYQETWSKFLVFMAEQTGKEVNYLVMDSADEQLQAIKDGQLHITGINPGAVPIAVNACGFVPVYGFGKDGSPITYTMKIIVPKGSVISKVSELAGHTLTLTTPASNSGWKAPLTLLKRDFQLLPVRDFAIIFSGSHLGSLQRIASGTSEIAATASDEMNLAITHGHVSEDQIKTIYESEPFPNNIFGHLHNLQPALAEKVRQSFIDFPWSESELETVFGVIGAAGFQAISYKDDLKLIREIDDAMGRRHRVGTSEKDNAG